MQERGVAYEAYEGGAFSSLNLSISIRKLLTSSLQASLSMTPLCPAPVLFPTLGPDVDTFRKACPELAILLTGIEVCTVKLADDLGIRKGIGIISLWSRFRRAWLVFLVPELIDLTHYSSLYSHNLRQTCLLSFFVDGDDKIGYK